MTEERATRKFDELLELTRHLRSPAGCAWDRAQSIDTLRPHLVEEFHECLEALDAGDDERFADELGELLFLIVFMAAIAEDDGRFSLASVIGGIDHKLRRRHPHVFGDLQASTPDEVRSHWETTKLSEESHAHRSSILDGLPAAMPALLTARRIQEKAAAVGFDWADIRSVFAKIDEEVDELRGELDHPDSPGVAEEVGDLLFAVVNVARFLSIDPEAALRKTNLKFRRRFSLIEERFRGRDLREVGLEAMDVVWEEAKDLED